MKNSIDKKAETALEKALPPWLTSLFVKEKKYVFITDLEAFITTFKQITGYDLEIEYCPNALYFYRFTTKPKEHSEQSNYILDQFHEEPS
jgi:hypothetical protein